MITKRNYQKWAGFAVATLLVVVGVVVFQSSVFKSSVKAAIPPPGPQSGSVGVEGTIPSPAPTQAATIVRPANGQVFSSIPVTVSGFCPANTIVKIFSNNIFVGSAVCTGNSYSLEISLFSGQNDLVARVFDALDQQGPDSNTVTVTFNDAQFGQFGSHVLLTSQYARRAAQPGQTLSWPLILSGGLGPYALSIDWGDGSPVELRSIAFAGVVNVTHIYKTAGTYPVTFKAVDANGTAAFLQVIAVATGSVKTNQEATSAGNKTTVTETKISLTPVILTILFAPISFWLGRRYELAALRKRLEREYRQQ